MIKSDHIFTTKDVEDIRVTTFGELSDDNPRCVIYVHGFKGFKDWGFVPAVGEYLERRGFYVVTFNFSHNGVGQDLTEFTELDKFEKNTLSREVEELREISIAVKDGYFGDADNLRIGFLGHSRGGGISLLTAPLVPQVRAVSTWSSVSTFERYSPEEIRIWHEKGYKEVVNARTGQVMRLGIELLEDFEKHREDRLNIEKAVRSLGSPLLIAHGEGDESVPVAEARQIYEWAMKDNTELFIIPGTGHTFGAGHPYTGSNSKLDALLDRTAGFFAKHL